MAPRSTPEQQSAAALEFIELEDALVDKAWNIPEGNVKSRVVSLTSKLSWGAQPARWKLQKDILLFYTILLTDSGEPEYYEKALQVEAKTEWELAMDDDVTSLMENQTWDLVELSESKCALHNK